MKKLYFITFFAICLLGAPPAHASIYNDAKAYVVRTLSGLTSWWNGKSINPPLPPFDKGGMGGFALSKGGEGGFEEGETPGDETPAPTGAPGMCQVAQQPPIIVCEKGSGFLCINTPEPGVSGNSIIIKGTIDRAGSVPASISISVQHEYTKRTSVVDTSGPETADCWTRTLDTKPFCIDEDGFYAAKIPLSDLGPYTIAIGATRLAGQAVTQTVRTSRVKALEMADDQVTFDPDVRTTTTVEDPYVNITVSLIGECQHCDLIGASTFGVTVTVENVMRDSSGNTSRITCATNVEQGGQGRFIVGIPVGLGSNELQITACNAAVAQGSCPKISGVSFQGAGGITGIQIQSPPPLPAYSSSEYPKIPFEFKIGGIAPDECVNVTFNRDQPVEVCPSSDGGYSIELFPQVGINVVTVDNEERGVHIPWIFGWGSIVSPFEDPSDVKDGLISNSALQVAIPKSTFTDILAPMISNILSSDELAQFISKIGEDPATGDTQQTDAEEIPKCDSGSLGDLSIGQIREPKIGKAKVEGISFESNTMHVSINADDVEIKFDLKSGESNVPLKVSFRKMIADLMLKVENDGLVLLTSPHTDCDYKKERYCKGTPAPLIPKNFLGNATQFAGIVRCDAAGEFCDDFNSLNAQTGLMNEKVLDAINSAIYCGGSKMLTKLSREGMRKKIDLSPGDAFGAFSVPVGANLGEIKIDNKGMLVNAGIIAGDREMFSQMQQKFKIPSVGVVTQIREPYLKSVGGLSSQLRLAVAVDAINHLLFVGNSLGTESGRGLLDIDLSEPFFNRAGFDFVQKCDAFVESGAGANDDNTRETSLCGSAQGAEAYSPLCNLRPRVSELLGTPLTRYNYFPAKHPLLVRIRGNRALPPHISVVNSGEIPIVTPAQQGSTSDEPGDNLIDFQIGGLILSFYALEVDETTPVDEYGNLPIKLDADGNPVIHSMRPDDPDPSHGQIASFELALLLAVEISDIETDSCDPSRFVAIVRPLADRSRLVISPVAGSNTTTIPPQSLIAALREKLQYAINIYSSKEDAIRIPIPKALSFAESQISGDSPLFEGGTVPSFLGLKTITFGPEGLKLAFDEGTDTLVFDISAAITQLLHIGGQQFEDTLPH